MSQLYHIIFTFLSLMNKMKRARGIKYVKKETTEK